VSSLYERIVEVGAGAGLDADTTFTAASVLLYLHIFGFDPNDEIDPNLPQPEIVKALVDLGVVKEPLPRDEVVAAYFQEPPASVPLESPEHRGRQIQHMKSFLMAATGGPNTYAGRAMNQAHQHLGVDDPAFDRVLYGHVAATLTALGVPGDLTNEIAAAVEGLRPEIVTA
jgi:hypothetical protein